MTDAPLTNDDRCSNCGRAKWEHQPTEDFPCAPAGWIACSQQLPASIQDNVLARIEGRFAVQGFVTDRKKTLRRHVWMVYDVMLGDYAECPRQVTHWRPL